MTETAKLLGIDVDQMATKCSDFSRFYLKCAMQKLDFKEVVEYIKENFDQNELVFMSLYWLNDKTEEVTTEAIKRFVAKHNPN